jgi:pimeloyl-ACP methyl ester carboxylesterase
MPAMMIPIQLSGSAARSGKRLARAASAACILVLAAGSTALGTDVQEEDPVPLLTSISSLDFGAVPLGFTAIRLLAVTNVTEAPVGVLSATTTNAGFGVLSTNLPVTVEPWARVELLLRFTPQSSGSHTGRVTVAITDPIQTHLDIPLAGLGYSLPANLMPKIEAAPAEVDFGALAVGESLERTFLVRNRGDAPLFVGSVEVEESAFSVVSPTGSFSVEPGEQRQVTVRFSPARMGAVVGQCAVNSSDPENGTVMVALQGEGLAPVIELSETELDFGAVDYGALVEREISVRNRGNASLTLDLAEVAGPGFDLSGLQVGPLLPGESAIITVGFSPTQPGEAEGVLRLASNDPVNPRTEVRVSGFGLMPELTYEPATLNFGPVSVGESRDLSFLVRNTGTIPLTVTGMNTNNRNFVGLSPNPPEFTLEPGQEQTVVVRFVPSAGGGDKGLLRALSNDPLRPVAMFTLEGIGLVSKIEVTPASLDFGLVPVTESKRLPITIRNLGEGILSVESLASNNAAFGAITGTPPLRIAPGASADVTVEFSPCSDGSHEGELLIRSNDPEQPITNVRLLGSGTSSSTLGVLMSGSVRESYEITFSDNSKHTIDADVEVELRFKPLRMLRVGGVMVSDAGDMEGHIHSRIRAVEIRGNEQTIENINRSVLYDFKGYPIRAEFDAASGQLLYLGTDLADPALIASQETKPYRLEYSAATGVVTLWIRLPRPFRYPPEFETYEGFATACVSGRSGTAMIRVLVAGSRLPISGVSVSVEGTEPSTTDSSGRVTFQDLSPGERRIELVKERFEPLVGEITIPPFQASAFEFLLTPVTMLTASVELVDEPRPILPGQRRSARLTIQNATTGEISGFLGVELFLSPSGQLESGFFVDFFGLTPMSLGPGETRTLEWEFLLPTARELGSKHAGLTHLIARVELHPTSGPEYFHGSMVASSAPFWLGQIIKVLTHGFGRDLRIPIVGPVMPDFMEPWEQMSIKFQSLASDSGLPIGRSLRRYIHTWNSSEGWIEAAALFLLQIYCEMKRFSSGAVAAALGVQAYMGTAAARAAEGAYSARNFLFSFVSPELTQNDFQVIHLIGHSRGAAVNARLARLLAQDGVRIHQYTGLDGYGPDWPPPSHILADIDIVEELSMPDALEMVLRRVNYRVEDGLFAEKVADLFYTILEPLFRLYYYSRLGIGGDFNALSAEFKAYLRERIPNFYALDRPEPLFENILLQGKGEGEDARSNHLNVVQLYLESGEDPRGEEFEYLLDNPFGREVLAWRKRASAQTLLSTHSLGPFPTVSSQSPARLMTLQTFRDGSFEELGQLQELLEETTFPEPEEGILRVALALLRSSNHMLSAMWETSGELSLVRSRDQWAVELTQSEDTSLGQFLVLGPAAEFLGFDLNVLTAEAGDFLEVLLDEEIFTEIPLEGHPGWRTYAVPLDGKPGPARFVFRLRGVVNEPSVIQLDNFIIHYNRPRITELRFERRDQVRVIVEGIPGLWYRLEATEDLETWTTVASAESMSGTAELVDETAEQSKARFYRVQVEAQPSNRDQPIDSQTR